MVAIEPQVQDEKPAEILVSSRRSLGVDLGGIVHRTLLSNPHVRCKTCLIDAQTKAWKKRKIPATNPHSQQLSRDSHDCGSCGQPVQGPSEPVQGVPSKYSTCFCSSALPGFVDSTPPTLYSLQAPLSSLVPEALLCLL